MERLRPVCKYGASCYRKNPDHLKAFSHEDELEEKEKDPDPILLPPSKRAKVNEEDSISDIPLPTQLVESVANAIEEGTTTTTMSTLNTDELLLGGDPKPKDNVQKQFLVDFPEDFYLFWEFCNSLDPKNPSTALKPLLGLELVGAYDVLSGRLEGVPWEKCVLHSRHYFDPPELSTVLVQSSGDAKEYHIGYFRDDPRGEKWLLVSNDSAKGCELVIKGSNIFSVAREEIQRASRNKNSLSKDDAEKLKNLDSELSRWMSKLSNVSHEKVADLHKKRRKESVAVTFNNLGIVVPYDKKTELGYRPLPLSKKELMKLLNKISNCNGDTKDQVFEPLQEIITYVQFANDESDYGMGMELGMDLFCHGDPYFHKVTELLLPLAYELLQRDTYAEICRMHLKQRKRTPLNYAK